VAHGAPSDRGVVGRGGRNADPFSQRIDFPPEAVHSTIFRVIEKKSSKWFPVFFPALSACEISKRGRG
jgi:hypothetical protein